MHLRYGWTGAGLLWMILLCAGLYPASAQPRLDSLQMRLGGAEGRARVDLLNEIAAAHLASSPGQGVEVGREAFEEAARFGYVAGQAQALSMIGQAYFGLTDYEAAVRSHEQALALFARTQDRSGTAYCYNGLGNAYHRLGRHDAAAAAFRQALRLVEQEDDQAGIARVSINLGLLYWRTGDYAQALTHYQRGLAAYETAGDLRNFASTLNNIGVIYYQWASYENALSYYNRSLAMREALGDWRGVAIVQNNIGLAYIDWGRLDQALQIFLEAYERVDTLQGDMVLGYTLNNIATIYVRQGAYDQALTYYEKSLAAYEAANEPGGVVLNLNGIGMVYQRKGDAARALTYLQEALGKAQALGMPDREAEVLRTIGQVRQGLGEYEPALAAFRESLAISRAIKKRDLMKEDAYHLASLYERMGDYEQALRFHKQYAVLKDSLFDERSDKLLADMEMKYESEKKENALLRQARGRQDVILLSVSVGLVLVLLLVLVLYRANRQKQEANRMLAAYNEQIARQRDEQNELLHVLSHDLANPLGSVKGCLELILEEPEALDELGPIALTVARKGIDIITLVRRMRALEEGKLVLELVNLHEAADEAALVVRDRLLDKQITLVNNIPPELEVVAERISLVSSVLTNILTNAIKFSYPEGTVCLGASAEGPHVVLSVRDQGIGMPAQIRVNLFDLNKATSRAGTWGEEGNGFGMPMVKKFVSLYGGEVEVYSHEAQERTAARGTEVRILLRRAPQPLREEEDAVGERALAAVAGPPDAGRPAHL